MSPNGFAIYMASGPGEEIDAANTTGHGTTPPTLQRHWVPAASPMRESIYPDANQAHSADSTGDNPWGLVPDQLPHMEYHADQRRRRSFASTRSPAELAGPS